MACIFHIRSETAGVAFLNTDHDGERVSALSEFLQSLTACVGVPEPYSIEHSVLEDEGVELLRPHHAGPGQAGPSRAESSRVDPSRASSGAQLCRLTPAKSNRLCRITGHLAVRNNSVIPASFCSMRPAGRRREAALHAGPVMADY